MKTAGSSHRIGFVLWRLLLCMVFASIGTLATDAHAVPPTTNITSSGLGTTVTPNGNERTITGGTRSGANLFHSFGEFSVGSGDIANFFNDSGLATNNILSRVTGGNVSNIFGTIKTTNFGSANLFLLNPAGVIFGPNASLDIGGSFHISTADYLKFSNGDKFFVNPSNPDTVLSIAAPAAFGFLGPAPAPISFQGSALAVAGGKTISVVGGDISIDGGNLSAPSGRIQIASLGSDGEVYIFSNFSQTNPQGSPVLRLDGVTSLGQLDLLNDPVLEGGTGLIRAANTQITMIEMQGDGSLNKIIPLFGPDYVIPGDRGQTQDNNLFLTFGLFDLMSGESATFQAPSEGAPTNILARVTGGQSSLLDGTLDWFSGDKPINMYFLNPAGVSIGSSVSLGGGVTGSFHVSTADYLRLGPQDGEGSGIFYTPADKMNQSILTGAAPSAFGFESSTPGAITFSGGELIVPEGQTLSLVGGDITITGGHLSAPSGRIQIASVSSPGEVSWSPEVFMVGGDPATLSLNPLDPGQPASVGGQIRITQGALIEVDDQSGIGGGTVLIHGGAVVVDGRNTAITSVTQGDVGVNGAPVGIDLQADSLTVTGGARIETETQGEGNAGNVNLTINGGPIVISGTDARPFPARPGRSRIRSLSTGGGGASGSVTLDASTSSLEMDGGLIETNAQADGPGGNVSVNVGSARLSNGGEIKSTSSGGEFAQAGNVLVTAANSLELSGIEPVFGVRTAISSFSFGDAPSGTVTVEGESIALSGGAQIKSESFFNPVVGDVTVTAHNTLSISGKDTSNTPSGIFSFTLSEFETGQPGNIIVNAGTISLTNGALIESGNIQGGPGGNLTVSATGSIVISSQSGISSLAFAQPVGNVTVSAPSLVMSGGFIRTSTTDIADSGNIIITAGSVQLSNAAEISAKSTGAGLAGDITIDAGSSFVAANSKVTTEASQSDGGNITINARDLIHLTNSQVTSSVGSPTITTTQGGNIIIDPTFIILNNSQIIAQAFAGTGGNITITAGALFIDPASVISASSQLGVSGTVNIQAPINNLSEAVSPLSATFQQAAALLQARCAAQMGGRLSTFVLAGRDGIPAEPGGLLPSPPLTASLPTATTAAYTGADVDGVSVRLARLGIPEDGLRLSGGWHLSSTAQEALAMGCAG